MLSSFRKEWIPWGMAAGRAALGPVLIAAQRSNWNAFALAGIVAVALVSDIYDGVLARRWGCDTAGVRLFDSMADTVFYLCTAVALWIGEPRIWHTYGTLLGVLLTIEAMRFAFDFWKYGKPGSYHSYLAKTLGLVLAVGVIATFAMGRPNVLIPVALCLGIASNLEGLAMSLMLPVWRRDVKTLAAAWRLRQELRQPVRVMPAGAVATLVLALCATATSLADEPVKVTYGGGTAPVKQGATGLLDASSPTGLLFRTHNSEVSIPYAGLKIAQESTLDAHHLGFFPLLAERLVRPKPRRHLFTFTYLDTANVQQVAVFEVLKGTPRVLCVVLKARAPESARVMCSGGAL